ncbi:MAG: SusC/RagA family TonB-linked outer membrane protein [Deinococcales bacterium]|nr:SusC/RagA family TonB-linked outer membrane protein [Chitinophagaceae bacterium]
MRKISTMLLCLLLAVSQLFAQNKIITGKVVDEKGIPVFNATVLLKGSTKGTTTGTDGSFSISVPTTAKTLVISSVNYNQEEVSIKGSSINVTLQSTTASLDEVVVVAYGTQRKEAVTGSIGIIKAENIAKRPIGNITSAIEGAIPGVVTSTTSGQPGSGLAIRVRGFGSINATSEPLYVVDGAPYVGGTSNINPDDVESITVLKDAASSALYGSRAANGVVLITTKKGLKGRNAVSVKGTQGIATRGLAEYDRIDAFQYYPVMWEAYRNSLVYPATGIGISQDSANRVASGLTTRTGIQGLLSYNPFNVANNAIVGTNGQLNPNAQLLYGDDLDWTKDLLRNGIRKDYNVNFNGGADKSDYFLSLGYLNEEGYTIKSDFERFTARLNVNVQPKTWLKTGLNISGNYTTSNTARDGGSTNFVNPFFFSRNVGPIYPVYAHNMTTGALLLDGTGNKFWDLGNMGGTSGVPNRPSGGFGGRHALAETILNEQIFRRTVVSARSYVDVTFLKDFKFSNTFSVDFQNAYSSAYDNTLVGDGAPAGRSQKDGSSVTGFLLNQILSYGKSFGDHRIDALAAHESYNEIQSNINGFKQGQSLSGNTELGNFTTINSTGSSIDRYRIESYFSRLNYSYRGKYNLSGSIRRDGNSRFAPESRWGTFWSVGGSWNVDKEDFMKNVTWIDNLKLRSSYGVVGVADGIGFYAYQGLYVFANNANEPGIVQSQTSFLNKELTWEDNKQFDLGLDIGFFKNRLNLSVEYYNRQSVDLLFAVPQALSSGALSINQNTATLYNKGIELQISGDIVKTKNFTWNMNVNLSTVTNQITKMPASVPEFITGTKKYAVGVSIFDYYLRTYYGVDPTDGAALYVAANTTPSASRRLITNKVGGIDTVTTLASNGKFEFQGTSIPDLYGSVTETISFKQFSLSALFTFQLGGKTYDANYQGLMSSGSYGGALHTDILNRWQKPGDISYTPRLDASRTTDFNAQSSRWLVDASYFNIRTINLSYTLPKVVASRFKIDRAQFFVSVENVAFMSKRKGLNNQQAFSGVTSNAYPPARIVSAGITLNF